MKLKLLRRIGETLETSAGIVDLVAVRRVLKGDGKVYLRAQERQFIYEQYGISEEELRLLRRAHARKEEGK
jgi:hypothetical protein